MVAGWQARAKRIKATVAARGSRNAWGSVTVVRDGPEEEQVWAGPPPTGHFAALSPTTTDAEVDSGLNKHLGGL